MRAAHGTYSVRRVFMKAVCPHLRGTREKDRKVSHPISLTRLLSIGVMGLLAVIAFAMVLMPQPSLYAG